MLKSFDLLAPEGYGELCSGSEREHEYARIITRIRETGENPSKYRWYLDMARDGIPASAGFGLGLERLTRYIAGLHTRMAGQRLPQGPGSAVAVSEMLHAHGFPEDLVRSRAREGKCCAFPDRVAYGRMLFGAGSSAGPGTRDALDELRLVPPVFMPERLEKLIELGREPLHTDVDLETVIGGLRSPAAALRIRARLDRGRWRRTVPSAQQTGRLAGHPHGHRREHHARPWAPAGCRRECPALLSTRITAYAELLPDGLGGIVVQQSTEDADAEVWNMVYSDPGAGPLLASGRLAFELKVGQGAKPGLGGMTVLDEANAAAMADRFALDRAFDEHSGTVLRFASPGTFTEEILHHQVRLMRNNYPRAKVWVKLHPGRDVREAALTAWAGRRGRGDGRRGRGRIRLGAAGASSTMSGCRWPSACCACRTMATTACWRPAACGMAPG